MNKSLGLFEVKTNFSRVAEEVHSGKTIIVTKNGVPFIELNPIIDQKKASAKQAVLDIKQLREEIGIEKIDIKSMIELGRL